MRVWGGGAKEHPGVRACEGACVRGERRRDGWGWEGERVRVYTCTYARIARMHICVYAHADRQMDHSINLLLMYRSLLLMYRSLLTDGQLY